MLEELAGDVLIGDVVPRQDQRDPQHVERIHRHPRRPIGLVQRAAGRQRLRAVEQPDVVQPQEPALEHVAPVGVLAVNPPGEVQHQLVEHPHQEAAVRLARQRGVGLIDPQRRPSLDRRVHVAERPLIGRQLAVRVHVPLARQQQELVLGEGRVHRRQGDAVERQVPSCEPGILPGVRHGDDIRGVEVPPVPVAPGLALRRRGRRGRIAVQPERHVEVVELLGPQQSGNGLAMHPARVRIGDPGGQGGVILVRLVPPLLQDGIEAAGRVRLLIGPQPDTELHGLAGGDGEDGMGGGLGALAVGRHDAGKAVHHEVPDPVLERPGIMCAIKPVCVGFVLAEQQGVAAFHAEAPAAPARVLRQHRPVRHGAQQGARTAAVPGPPVARPKMRQDVQWRRDWAVVAGGDLPQDVLRPGLRPLHRHVEVPGVHHAAVGDLPFRAGQPAAAVLLD